ncbi:MAG: hypothetical protein WDA47_04175 [Bacilli bacterium]|jgi:hypothetical protein
MSYSKRLLTQKYLYNLILILILVVLLGIGYLSYREERSEGQKNGSDNVLNWVDNSSIVANRIPPISDFYVLGINVSPVAYKVIACESGFKHDDIWGDNGKAFGVAQFWEDTFYWFADMAGLENPDWYNKEQQIYLLEWALENPPLQNHWTCYRNL